MKQLTCEMCGSNDLLKQDGVFVCQTCGTKYSVEEAKKMMIEGTVEVSGVVRVDQTNSIENYLKIANTAYSSQNHAEAEKYANKVIEIEPDNYKAWLIKGKAAGWQSTLANPRFPECISSFSAALNNTPDEDKDRVVEEIKEEIKDISCALISLRAERFIKWPDGDEATGFITDITTILKTVTAFLVKGVAISITDIMSPVAEMINQSVINAYKNTIFPDYKSKEYPYPNDRDFSQYVERISYCIQLVEQSIELCDNDSEADIQRYRYLIDLQEYAIKACSYDWHHPSVRLDSTNASMWTSKGYDVDIYNNRVYFVKSTLSDSAKSIRQNKIAEYKSHISKIEAEIDRKAKAEKQKQYTEFWVAHKNERKFLTAELEKSKNEREKLINANTGHTKVSLLDKHISMIENILEKDRTNISQMPNQEQVFIDRCSTFWDNLLDNDGYDMYLDQNPILKQANALAEKRISLLKRKFHIERSRTPKKPDALLPASLCTAFGVFITFLGIILVALDSSAIFLIIGILFTVGCGIATCIYLKQYADSKAEVRNMEEAYKKDVREYNATIAKMCAVPKYTGQVDEDRLIQIPERIDES